MHTAGDEDDLLLCELCSTHLPAWQGKLGHDKQLPAGLREQSARSKSNHIRSNKLSTLDPVKPSQQHTRLVQGVAQNLGSTPGGPGRGSEPGQQTWPGQGGAHNPGSELGQPRRVRAGLRTRAAGRSP